MSIGWIVALALVAFFAFAYWRQSSKVKKEGLTALATIINLRSGGGGDGSDANFMTLTVKWHDANGYKRTAETGVSCDLGDMPREGDQIQITYLADEDYVELQSTGFYLRHDQLTPGGEV